MADFSPGLGLRYEAGLFRSTGTGASALVGIGGADAVQVVSIADLKAEFDLSDLPVGQRSGEFSVKARLCVYDLAASPQTLQCGAYGTDGGKSVTLVPAPSTPTVTLQTNGDVLVSWTCCCDYGRIQAQPQTVFDERSVGGAGRKPTHDDGCERVKSPVRRQ